jgi:hypothetical protein
VDDFEGAVHRAYGSLPNMTYVIGAGGRIIYRANWTDARTVAVVLDQMAFQSEQREARTRMTPYYLEWAPMREANRVPFLEILLEVAGRRAVEEFIAAVSHTSGAMAARSMERWWDERRAG